MKPSAYHTVQSVYDNWSSCLQLIEIKKKTAEFRVMFKTFHLLCDQKIFQHFLNQSWEVDWDWAEEEKNKGEPDGAMLTLQKEM